MTTWELLPALSAVIAMIIVLTTSRTRKVEGVLDAPFAGWTSLSTVLNDNVFNDDGFNDNGFNADVWDDNVLAGGLDDNGLTDGGRAEGELIEDPDDEFGVHRIWRWTVDLSLTFTYSSPACLQLIGYGPAELVGRSVDLIIDPVELQRADDLVNSTVGARGVMPSMVVTGNHRDGSSSWFEVEFRPRFGPDGEIVDFQGSSRMIGPNASTVLADQQTKQRIESLISNRLLMTAFQPIVGINDDRMIGVEALSRFVTEPDLGPDSCFAAAASVGLGRELELLAVSTALASAAEIPEHLYVSLNVSPATCLSAELAELLDASEISLSRIVLELTEHSRVDDYEPLNAALAGLRERGIRIAVDDAGAGFASFQHILQIRPEVIKLDRCIISGIDADPTRQALAGAVVTFAGFINACVVAEGIETDEELRVVREIGLVAGQGYLSADHRSIPGHGRSGTRQFPSVDPCRRSLPKSSGPPPPCLPDLTSSRRWLERLRITGSQR